MKRRGNPNWVKGKSGNPRGRPLKYSGAIFDEYHALKSRLDALRKTAQSQDDGRASWVYIVKAEGMWRYKIGFTNRLRQRFTALTVSSPLKLVMIASFRGSRMDEHAIQSEYAQFRVHGEWFDLTPEQVQEIIGRFGGQTPEQVARKSARARADEAPAIQEALPFCG